MTIQPSPQKSKRLATIPLAVSCAILFYFLVVPWCSALFFPAAHRKFATTTIYAQPPNGALDICLPARWLVWRFKPYHAYCGWIFSNNGYQNVPTWRSRSKYP